MNEGIDTYLSFSLVQLPLIVNVLYIPEHPFTSIEKGENILLILYEHCIPDILLVVPGLAPINSSQFLNFLLGGFVGNKISKLSIGLKKTFITHLYSSSKKLVAIPKVSIYILFPYRPKFPH